MSFPADDDRVVNGPGVVAEAVGEYGRAHGRLPTRIDQIRPYIEVQPAQWRPAEEWPISWRLLDRVSEDKSLALLRVRIVTPRGAFTEDVPCDLRDPEKTWTSRLDWLIERVRPTPKQVSDGLAYRIQLSLSFEHVPTWDTLNTPRIAGEAPPWATPRTHAFRFGPREIVVRHLATGKERRYPRQDPSDLNTRVAPLSALKKTARPR